MPLFIPYKCNYIGVVELGSHDVDLITLAVNISLMYIFTAINEKDNRHYSQNIKYYVYKSI